MWPASLLSMKVKKSKSGGGMDCEIDRTKMNVRAPQVEQRLLNDTNSDHLI